MCLSFLVGAGRGFGQLGEVRDQQGGDLEEGKEVRRGEQETERNLTASAHAEANTTARLLGP